MSVFTGVQMAGIACSVVRAKLIALWIGPIGVAYFGIFNNALDMLGSATQLNLRQSAVRDISAATGPARAKTVAAVRWWARNLGLLGALTIVLASPLLSLISFGSAAMWWGFAALCVAMAVRSFTSGEQAIMQGTGQLKPLAKSTMIGAIGGTAVSIPMYYFLGINCIAPSIIAFALASALACMHQNSEPRVGIKRRESIAIGKSFIRLGTMLTISSIAAYAASYIFLSYLNQRASADVAGAYQAGYTLIVQYIGLVFYSLSMEYYPRLVPAAQRKKAASLVVSHEMSLLLCALTPIAVVFVSAGQLMLNILYSPKFMAAMPLITIGIGGAIFRAISYCMSYVILARGDGRTFIVTEVTSAAIGLTLNILLYNAYGMAGLGFSYVLWYAAYTVIIAIAYRRYGMRLTPKAIAIAIASLAITAAAIALRTLPCSLAWALPLALLPLCALLASLARRKK